MESAKAVSHSMEKTRRKRVNTSLEQLRSLLPFSTNMKRDMASMLEQAVEYINTMHTVLNQEEPACLSKVYEVYQSKMEETDGLRKAPKSKKKESPNCFVGSINQPVQYATAFEGANISPAMDNRSFEPDFKRRCTNTNMYTPHQVQQPQPNMLPPINCTGQMAQCSSHVQQNFGEQTFQTNNPGSATYTYYPYGRFMNSTRPPPTFYNSSPSIPPGYAPKVNDVQSCCSIKATPPYSKIENIPKPLIMGSSATISPNPRNMDMQNFMPVEMMNMQNIHYGRNTPMADINSNYIGMMGHSVQHFNPCISPTEDKIKIKITPGSSGEMDFNNNNSKDGNSIGLQSGSPVPEFQNQCVPLPVSYISSSISKQPITPIFTPSKFVTQANSSQTPSTIKGQIVIQPTDGNNNPAPTPMFSQGASTATPEDKSASPSIDTPPSCLHISEESNDQLIPRQTGCDLSSANICQSVKWQETPSSGSNVNDGNDVICPMIASNGAFAEAVNGKMTFSFEPASGVKSLENDAPTSDSVKS